VLACSSEDGKQEAESQGAGVSQRGPWRRPASPGSPTGPETPRLPAQRWKGWGSTQASWLAMHVMALHSPACLLGDSVLSLAPHQSMEISMAPDPGDPTPYSIFERGQARGCDTQKTPAQPRIRDSTHTSSTLFSLLPRRSCYISQPPLKTGVTMQLTSSP
jgi:hypothetical protein